MRCRGIRILHKKNSGSITVEAAIALPLFILAVLTLMSIFQVIYTYEAIYYALKKTSERISIYSYVYEVSGLSDKNAEVNNQIDEGKDILDKGRDIIDEISGLKNISVDNVFEQLNNISEYTEELTSQPEKGIEGVIYYLLGFAYSKGKGKVISPFIRQVFEKQLNSGADKSADSYLRLLRVKNGYEGIDFTESELLNDNESIKIVLKYSIKPIMPIPIVSEMMMKQSILARAWLDGDSCKPCSDGKDIDGSIKNIWNLHPLKRGREIAKSEGANLPDTAGAANAFNKESGTVTNIASIDITAKSYQNYTILKKNINNEIDRIYEFVGFIDQKKGLGIREDEIIAKQVVLVIPEVDVPQEVSNILAECEAYANEKDIVFKWKKAYGIPEVEKGG